MTLRSTGTILIPTDFSPASERAVTEGIVLAELLESSIELLHVGPAALAGEASTLGVAGVAGVAGVLPSDVPTAAQESESRQLEAAAARVRIQGIACSTARTFGTTHLEIVAHASKIGAGLIVLGSHEEHGIAATVLGHLCEKVVRNSICPVLVVPMLGLRPAEEPVTDALGLGVMGSLTNT